MHSLRCIVLGGYGDLSLGSRELLNIAKRVSRGEIPWSLPEAN